MENKKAKLIVLIMIGVCAILLFVCFFTLMSLNKEVASTNTSVNATNTQKEETEEESTSNKTSNTANETKKSKLKNETKKNNTTNSVEILDAREREKEEEREKEKLNLYLQDSLDDWPEDETEFRTFDVSSYEKEVKNYSMFYESSNYVVSFNLPKDIPFYLLTKDKYYEDYYGSQLIFKNEDETVSMNITIFEDPMRYVENITVDDGQYADVKMIKLNETPGYEIITRKLNKVTYIGNWFLTEKDEEGNKIRVEVMVYGSDRHSEEDFNIEEFVKSDDFQYFIASFKAIKQ